MAAQTGMDGSISNVRACAQQTVPGLPARAQSSPSSHSSTVTVALSDMHWVGWPEPPTQKSGRSFEFCMQQVSRPGLHCSVEHLMLALGFTVTPDSLGASRSGPASALGC